MFYFNGYSKGLLPEKVNIGTLSEFPEICINAFSNSPCAFVDWEVSRAFFITHVEEEILKDFLNASFLKKLLKFPVETMRVYLHEVTYTGILYWISTQDSIHNKSEQIDMLERLLFGGKICFLEKNVPVRFFFVGGLRYPGIGLTVEITALSAGHNPGSIMLLLEYVSGPSMRQHGTQKHVILYTGNCRVSTNDLRHSQPLFNEKGELKKLTSLYVDTMHCASHVKELPLRSFVEQQLVLLLAEEVLSIPNTRFEIWTPFRISSFNFFCTLHELYKEPIHTTQGIREFLEEIPELIGVSSEHNGSDCRFHYGCASHNQNEDCAVNKMDDDFEVIHVVLKCDMFPSAVEPTEDELMWNAAKKSVYFKEPDVYVGVYSSNLSRYELARLVNYLGVDPLTVKPLHRPRFMKVSHVRRLLRKTCEELADCPESVKSLEEYPSRLYDFTGPNLATENFYSQARMVYIHMYPEESEMDLAAVGQGDHTSRINCMPDELMVPPIQSMDLGRVIRIPKIIRILYSSQRSRTATGTSSSAYYRPRVSIHRRSLST